QTVPGCQHAKALTPTLHVRERKDPVSVQKPCSIVDSDMRGQYTPADSTKVVLCLVPDWTEIRSRPTLIGSPQRIGVLWWPLATKTLRKKSMRSKNCAALTGTRFTPLFAAKVTIRKTPRI